MAINHPAITPSNVWAICPKCFHGRDYIGNGNTCDAITNGGFCGEPLKRLQEPIPAIEFMRLSKDQRQDLKLARNGVKH